MSQPDGGTLFLDEISQMPLALQPKLLRVLQEQEITRIGESTPRKIDARIVAASNQNVEKMVEQETFREDLYFRLAVVPVNIPPLRTRREDIPLLVNHFFKRAKVKHGFEHLKIGREVTSVLSDYTFPGNVRELENLIERMVVLSDGEKLTLEDVPPAIVKPAEIFGNVRIRTASRKHFARRGGTRNHSLRSGYAQRQSIADGAILGNHAQRVDLSHAEIRFR